MSRTTIFISILTVVAFVALSWATTLAASESDGHLAMVPGVAQSHGRQTGLEATEEPTAEPTEEPTAEPTEEPTVEPTEEPTEEGRHPVAWKIAVYFGSGDVTPEPTEEPTAEPTEEPTAEPTEEPTAEPTEEPEEPTADELYEQIMELHSEGVGFGVIAQAFFIAEELEEELTEEEMAALVDELGCDESGCTAFDLIQAKQDGTMSWGEIKKLKGHPGNKGENLGKIMSGRGGVEDEEEEGVTATSEDQGGKTPPGQAKGKKKGGPPKDKGGGKGHGKHK